MGRVNVEIKEEQHKRMKVACAIKDQTIIDFINKAIEEKLKNDK